MRPIEPDEQMAEIISGYDQETLDAVDLLRSNAWTTFDSAHSVEFGDWRLGTGGLRDHGLIDDAAEHGGRRGNAHDTRHADH